MSAIIFTLPQTGGIRHCMMRLDFKYQLLWPLLMPVCLLLPPSSLPWCLPCVYSEASSNFHMHNRWTPPERHKRKNVKEKTKTCKIWHVIVQWWFLYVSQLIYDISLYFTAGLLRYCSGHSRHAELQEGSCYSADLTNLISALFSRKSRVNASVQKLKKLHTGNAAFSG